MKSPELTLFTSILADCGAECSVDTTRDLETVTGRFTDQGLSFFTITLPTLEADLVRGLDQGVCTPDLFSGFRKIGRIPAFLGGFFELIFDRSTGVLLEDPSIPAIRSLRQLTLMFGKMKLESSPARRRKVLEGFLKCEGELRNVPNHISAEDRRRFQRIGSLLFGDIFGKLNKDISEFNLLPKHGPGTTADALVANAKYELPRWSERLESVFPYWKYGTSRSFSTTRYEAVDFAEPGAEIPVEVILVPKTPKSPRVIAREPTHMQYVQQGILERFTEYVEGDSLLKRMISTEHQEPNQLLACEGSLTGKLATLDLSEASDRVSNFLVKDLTVWWPHLHDALQVSRSQRASVPVLGDLGNEIGRIDIPLAKFASMGSAVCFPMEMAVFLTVVFMGVEKAKGVRFRRKEDFFRYVGSVRVYGDDIICPVDTTSSVMDLLALFGFVVNPRKSFWTGKFRESCGAEFYDGHDVTVTRVRREFPTSRRHVDEMVSAVDLRNQLYIAGYWSTVRILDDELSKLIPMPAVAETSSVLGKFSFLGYETGRIDRRLQRPMVKGVVVQYTPRRSVADGDAALMKFFLKRGDEPTFSKKHLIYAGRPIASRLYYGWAYSY